MYILFTILILVVAGIGVMMHMHMRRIFGVVPTKPKVEVTEEQLNRGLERRWEERNERLEGKQPINNPLAMYEDDGRLHDTKNKTAQFLVPENLSEEERAVLKDFYNL
jgi:hypothetical protein